MVWVWVVNSDDFLLCGVKSVESDDNDGDLKVNSKEPDV